VLVLFHVEATYFYSAFFSGNYNLYNLIIFLAFLSMLAWGYYLLLKRTAFEYIHLWVIYLLLAIGFKVLLPT
jgi:hypothetical protein